MFPFVQFFCIFQNVLETLKVSLSAQERGVQSHGVFKTRCVLKFLYLSECYCFCMWLKTQSCPTLCDPMDCSPPGFSVHGILQARILEWVAMSSSRGSSWSRDQTQASCIAGGFFTVWATGEVLFLYRLAHFFFFFFARTFLVKFVPRFLIFLLLL